MDNLQITAFIKKCAADPKIVDALKKARNSSEVGELIIKNGFDFQVSDFKKYIDRNVPLSDQELEKVAGGTGKISQSDVPDTLLALLTALKASTTNWI